METTNFRFLDLAAELRVRIYKYHIQSEYPGIFVSIKQPQPAIAAVSRLLRNECLPIFYSTCTFHVATIWRTHPFDYDAGTWAEVIGEEHCKCLERLRCNIKSSDRHFCRKIDHSHWVEFPAHSAVEDKEILVDGSCWNSEQVQSIKRAVIGSTKSLECADDMPKVKFLAEDLYAELFFLAAE